MAINRLTGTVLDAISQSNDKAHGYRVLLFDLLAADSVSDITLDRYTQVPLDITPYVVSVAVTQSHDTEGNQAQFSIVGTSLDRRLFNFSWVKVYEGDLRVDRDDWPVIFSGLFKGQPSRVFERGSMELFQHTAIDRSVFFRERNITSRRSWQPYQSDANLGEICVEIATNPDWGMGLNRQEVLFGSFFDNLGNEIRINKKLQVVDVPAMEALRNIMQVVQREPAFNGEGRLIARPVDLDRVAFRVHQNEDLIQRLDIPQNTGETTSCVRVTGLDFRMSRVDYPFQKMLTINGVTIGMFNPVITSREDYSDDREFRVVPHPVALNIQTQGSLLAQIFALDSQLDVDIVGVDDFSCEVTITFHGVFAAILIVTLSLALYIALRIAADAIGASSFILSVVAFALDITATILLFVVMQMMTAIGTLSFEIWGTPFEYVYRELEAKARVSDIRREEEQEHTVENHIIGTLDDAENLAFLILRRKIAETAGRNLSIASDFLLEPNDVIELEEEGEVARYYVLEISRNLQRGQDEPTMSVTAFRAR